MRETDRRALCKVYTRVKGIRAFGIVNGEGNFGETIEIREKQIKVRHK
jgi:hypothetical protein